LRPPECSCPLNEEDDEDIENVAERMNGLIPVEKISKKQKKKYYKKKMNRFLKNMKKKPTAVFHLITLDLIKCLLSDDVICISSCVCVCVLLC